MQFQIKVRQEDEEPLTQLAFDGHRSVREHADLLLHLKIQEDYARLKLRGEPLEPVA
jgi:hypothetical protein